MTMLFPGLLLPRKVTRSGQITLKSEEVSLATHVYYLGIGPHMGYIETLLGVTSANKIASSTVVRYHHKLSSQ